MTTKKFRQPWWMPSRPVDDVLVTLMRIETRLVAVEREMAELRDAMQSVADKISDFNTQTDRNA